MISRRQFIQAMIAGMATLSAGEASALEGGPSFRFQGTRQAPDSEFQASKRLNMYNIHTGEKLDVQYYSSGEYHQQALDSIHYFLRCHYTNEVKEIDIRVIDLLCDVKDALGKNREIQIISGYRSPAYNHFLVSLGRNVSPRSLHLQGLAIDFAVEGTSNSTLFQLARTFEAGGVGKYPDFVHIDVGRVRYW